jgi:ribose 5-phosphate isomerase A
MVFARESLLDAGTPAKAIDPLDQEKQRVAHAALAWVRSGMTMGLGSGTTSGHFIHALGERVRSGALTIEAVASSRASEAEARAEGIPVTPPRQGLRLDLTVDGADEVTAGLDLIKGHGGAMLRERVLVQASRYFLVIADSTKRVSQLGGMPVPVEVIPFALPWAADRIAEMGGRPDLRMTTTLERKPYLTDQQNYILDCHFGHLENPRAVAERLESIAGVVGHGIFLGCTNAALMPEAGEIMVFVPGRAPVPLRDFSPSS